MNANARIPQPYYDDEISLVDLARVLLRRKYWLIGTFLLCGLIALMYALSREHRYAFTTSIQLGEFGPDEFVSGAQATRNVIQDRILLSAKRAFLQDKALTSMPFDVSVTTADGNNFINLVSEAHIDRQELVADFHEQIFQRLAAEHQSRLSILERDSDARLETLKNALANEERQLAVLEGISVGATAEMMNERQNGREPHASSTSSAEGMQAQLSSSDAALTLLLSQLQVSDKIGEQRERINELKDLLREEEFRRSWIKPTRVDDVAVASLSPIGTGRSLILALGIILGGMLGLFMAFFVELVAKVRETEKEKEYAEV